jgi:ribosomal protein L24E
LPNGVWGRFCIACAVRGTGEIYERRGRSTVYAPERLETDLAGDWKCLKKPEKLNWTTRQRLASGYGLLCFLTLYEA